MMAPTVLSANMRMASIPRLLWIIPVLLLVIATWRLPYGYYTFTRIVTCGVALLIAIVGFQERPTVHAWSLMFVGMAVLFNPFMPIHLNRTMWFYLDLGAAAIFVAHLVLVRQRSES